MAEVKKVNEAHSVLVCACVVLRGRNLTDQEAFSLIKEGRLPPNHASHP